MVNVPASASVSIRFLLEAALEKSKLAARAAAPNPVRMKHFPFRRAAAKVGRMTSESKTPPADMREMYTEIAALIGVIAKALRMPDRDTAQKIESGAITLEFGMDANGNRFVAVTHEGRTAHVYQGAIKQEARE